MTNNQSKILIVDDNKSLCESLKDPLELDDYLVELAHTAEDCIKKVKSGFYNIVLLDLRLPDSEGILVLEKIKNISPDTEVIILTAFEDVGSVIKAFDKHAFSYIPKPFEIPHLITTLKKACESQRILFENRGLLQQLSLSKKDWEVTFDSISDLISIHDNDFNLLQCNKAFARKLNTTPDDLIGKKCHEIIHETDMPCQTCVFVKCKESLKPETEELESLYLGGSFQITCFPRIDDTGSLNGIVHIVKDITERKHAEEELKKHRDRLDELVKERTSELGKTNEKLKVEINEHKKTEDELKRIFELSVDMICVADIVNGYFIKINPSFGKVLGYSDKELLGRPLVDFVHPDDKAKTIDVIEKMFFLGAEITNFENRYQCKDGHYKWLMWTAHPIQEKGITYAIARDITKLKKDDEELRKQRDLLEENYGALKKAELARDAMTHMVIHDLKNSLAVALGNIQLLQYNISEDDIDKDELAQEIQVVRNSTEEMTYIINSILDISKLEAGKMPVFMTNLNADQVVKDIYEANVHHAKEKGKHLHFKQAPGPLIFKADKLLLCRVLQNILTNAITHTAKETNISISTEMDGGNAVICVADDGAGIHDTYKEKIFDKFFQIKTGTRRNKYSVGIGLAFCKMAIEAQDGKIWVESEEGKGACFKIALKLN